MITDYETLTSDLLEWIQKTITTLNDRQFANSLAGVQQQLATFNGYRTVEKPPKYLPACLSLCAVGRYYVFGFFFSLYPRIRNSFRGGFVVR